MRSEQGESRGDRCTSQPTPTLNTGNLSEIAYRVGFSDQAHFSRSFKRHFGMTPSEYREARPSAS